MRLSCLTVNSGVLIASFTYVSVILQALSLRVLCSTLFVVSYLLSRLALIPLKNAYESLVYFNQDIIHDLTKKIGE